MVEGDAKRRMSNRSSFKAQVRKVLHSKQATTRKAQENTISYWNLPVGIHPCLCRYSPHPPGSSQPSKLIAHKHPLKRLAPQYDPEPWARASDRPEDICRRKRQVEKVRSSQGRNVNAATTAAENHRHRLFPSLQLDLPHKLFVTIMRAISAHAM